MGLVSEPRREIEEKINKIYSFDSSTVSHTEDFTNKVVENYTPTEEERRVYFDRKNSFNFSTYGEITFNGVENILGKFSHHFNKDAVFFDLGSGVGKMNCHVSLRTDVARSIGVEFSDERVEAAKTLIGQLSFPLSVPEVIYGDMLQQDYAEATIVYFDNTVYPPSFLDKIINKLPHGCLLLYKSGGHLRGDRFFITETTYAPFSEYKKQDETEMAVWKYFRQRCWWRIIGE